MRKPGLWERASRTLLRDGVPVLKISPAEGAHPVEVDELVALIAELLNSQLPNRADLLREAMVKQGREKDALKAFVASLDAPLQEHGGWKGVRRRARELIQGKG